MLSQTLLFFLSEFYRFSLCESYGKGLFQFKLSETPICTYLGYFSSFDIFIYIVSFGGFVFKTVNIKINSFIRPDLPTIVTWNIIFCYAHPFYWVVHKVSSNDDFTQVTCGYIPIT